MSRVFFLLGFIITSHGLPVITERVRNPEEAGYFQGDIRFPDEAGLEKRSGIINKANHWPEGVVPIQIDPKFTSAEVTVLKSAIAEISSKTCIKFPNRTTQFNYISIDRGLPLISGCWSYVGKTNMGRQPLNLQPPLLGIGNCISKGIVAHELIHAIGFFHEQSRTDRDSFVKINWSNIPKGEAHNFEKYPSSLISDQGVSYDYGSLMHYGQFDFAMNQNIPTIIVPSGITIGNRNGLSDNDVKKIRNLYKC